MIEYWIRIRFIREKRILRRSCGENLLKFYYGRSSYDSVVSRSKQLRRGYRRLHALATRFYCVQSPFGVIILKI